MRRLSEMLGASLCRHCCCCCCCCALSSRNVPSKSSGLHNHNKQLCGLSRRNTRAEVKKDQKSRTRFQALPVIGAALPFDWQSMTSY